jgi:hypothetical protein
MTEDSPTQSISAGDNSILVQAGRDIVLPIRKSSPCIRLVRLTIEDDRTQRGLRQKLNIIVKNNGDITAFLHKGYLESTGHAELINCNYPHPAYHLSRADWQYDVNIDGRRPSFVGQHSIAPNEVANFDVMVGRRNGGPLLTIYRAFLRLEFDEGSPLETDPFHLRISGPTVADAFTTYGGPSPEEWGRCMADNIRRMDEIGYDLRPSIDPESAQYIEAAAPGLLDQRA